MNQGNRWIVIKRDCWASVITPDSLAGYYEATYGRIREGHYNVMAVWEESESFKTFDEAKQWSEKRVGAW